MAQKQAKSSKGAKNPRNTKAAAPKKEKSAARFSGQDVLHVVLIGVICTILFGGIGIVISMSKGIKGAQSTGGEVIAVNSTPVPTIPPTDTPTEIPCEAQAWWDAISSTTAVVINNAQTLAINLAPQQIKAGSDTAANWKTSLEAATNLPPCVQNAQQALVNAANETGALYGLYLVVSEQPDRGQQLLKTMDAYAAATDELEKLKITVNEDWFGKVRDFVRSECPAKHWFIEQFVVRDYRKFFEIMNAINPRTTTAADMQSYLITTRSLRASLTADKDGFPPCTLTAVDHLGQGMDALINAVNQGLGGDLNAMSTNLVTFQSEMTNFANELAKLDPTLIGPNAQEF